MSSHEDNLKLEELEASLKKQLDLKKEDGTVIEDKEFDNYLDAEIKKVREGLVSLITIGLFDEKVMNFEEDHDEVIHDGIPVDEDTRRKLRVRAMQKLVELKNI